MNDTIIYYKLQQMSDYIGRICAILLLKRKSKVKKQQKSKNQEKQRKNEKIEDKSRKQRSNEQI